MNAAQAPTEEIARYLDEVRAALADLPPSQRAELIEDLPAHLAEVAADADGGSLTDRLGAPETYAAELRAAAGIGAVRTRWNWPIRTAAVGRLRDQLRRADRRVGPLLGYATASDFVRLLRPAWWLVRGYVAGMLVLKILAAESGVVPDGVLGWLLVLAFTGGSVRLGSVVERVPARARWTAYAGAVAIGLLLVANEQMH